MRFPTSFLDDIRDRVPISTIVGRRVAFDRKKSNPGRGDMWACCPFHGEKSPSFHCEDRKGRYHCFGCGVSGDHFRFLTELEGLSFPEAVETVAGIAGVPMPARDPEMEKREREQASLFDVMEMATAYFQEQLQTGGGSKARAYLRERGLSPATQQTFRLGYSTDSRNALKEYLAGKGIAKDQIEACGLVVFGEDIPVSYDRFRDRIMFPIPDSKGRVIAFGGRAMGKDVPAKYLNSPDTELFHKGQVLFNFAKARKPAQDKGSVIAVEGYMDVIALAQAGFANAVAPLGTALTERQAELLWKMTSEPVLCFDGDQAGIKAAWRAADLILPLVKPGKTMRFALLPDGKDPDDLIKADGPDAFQGVLNESRSLIEIIWARETAGAVFDTPERRAELEQRLREITNRIQDESVRRHYSQDMRERMNAYFGQAKRSQGGQPRERGGEGQRQDRTAPKGRLAVSDSLARSALVRGIKAQPSLREAAILLTCVYHPTLVEEEFAGFESLSLANAELKALHAAILDAHADQREPTRSHIAAKLADAGHETILDTVDQMIRRARLWVATEEAAIDDAREAFRQALHLHHLSRTLHEELKSAELALASDATDENYARLIDVQSQMRAVHGMEALIEGFGVSSGRGSTNGQN
ncbi:MAG: DNA primase [Rhizobiaceae bacterium]